MSAITQHAPVPAHELVYEPKQLPKLRSNQGPYLDSASVKWMKVTPIDTPTEEIRRRFEDDGYVFVKNVLPRDDVLDMRQNYFENLAQTGILKPGTSPRDGIFNDDEDPIAHNGVGGPDLPENKARQEKLTTAHNSPVYLAFVGHPNLRGFVRELMGWEKDVLVKRTLLRHNVPKGVSTGIHYDQIFLRGGEAEFLTAWVPIGDVTAEGGGLMYLEHSDDIGRALERDFMHRAKDFTDEERISAFNQNMSRGGHLSHNAAELAQRPHDGRKHTWLTANYEAGDVVFHNPYLIHCAAKNEDPEGRIRLGTDLRFYEEGAPLDKRWMAGVWNPNDGL